MTKATYTNEEVQHMLESLFQEKKRAKQLQSELDFLFNERNQLQAQVKKITEEHSQSIAQNKAEAIEIFQKTIEGKEEKLKHAHLELLKKQRELATLNQSQKKGLDPEIENSLMAQIQKLKGLVLDYKKKYEEALSTRHNIDAESQEKNLKLQEANLKIFELLNLQSKQLQAIQSLDSQKSAALREADLAKLEASEAKATIQQLQKELSQLNIAFEDQQEDNISLKYQQTNLKLLFEELKQKLHQNENELKVANQQNHSHESLVAQLSGDNQRLETQKLEMLESLDDAHEMHEMQQQRIDQLAAVIMEKDRKIEELYEFQYSYKQLQEQNQALESALQDEVFSTKSMAEKNAAAEKKLADMRLHANQLEKGMQYLRVKTNEAKQESEQLGIELAASQDLSEQLSASLADTHAITVRLQHELQQEQLMRQEAFEELESIKCQFDSLKEAIVLAQQQVEQKSAELGEAEKTIASFKMVQQQQKQEMILKADQLCAIESEVEVIKHTIVKGIREAKELEARYYEAAQDKANIYYENQQLKQKVEQLHTENAEQMLKLQELQSHLEDTQTQIPRWQAQLAQAKQHEQEKQHLLFEKENKIAMLSQEMQRHSELIQSLQNQQNEREAQIKLAQQHLAKKVKDNTLLNEKIEEQRAQISELQTSAQSNHTKIIELKTSLENYQQQETRLQDLLNESIKAAELQAQKWEEKYFKLYEKWAETESLNKELKKLEEKYFQMQNLMASFRNVLGGGVTSTPMPAQQSYSPEPDPPERKLPPQEPMNKEATSNTPEAQALNMDLLSKTNPQTRYKHNLFE